MKRAPEVSSRTVKTLRPLPYHLAVREYLRAHEAELWAWYASAQALGEYADAVRLELLKSSYRLDAGTFAALHDGAAAAKEALGLDVPVTLYQSQVPGAMNARIHVLPGEAHVVLQGQVHETLSPVELRALLGHELAHYALWTADGGDHLTSFRILSAMAGDPRADNAHVETARRFEQCVEIFADRGALRATGDLDAVISSLVKVQTGLREVSAKAYLAQAHEIFARARVQAEGLSHPETFIRARALALWHEQAEAAEDPIREMIEGAATLRGLDLIGQHRLSALTRQVVLHALDPAWFATEPVVALAGLYFADLQRTPAERPLDALAADLTGQDPSVREFVGCVLLDFALADRALEDTALAHALVLGDRLGVSAELEERLRKETKLAKKSLEALKKKAGELLAAAGTHP